MNLSVMIDPKRSPVSDLDSGFVAPHSSWPARIGWVLVLAFLAFPFAWVFRDAVRDAQADAQFRRELGTEQKEMRALLAQLSRGNAEQKRLARELAQEMRKAGAR